MQFLRSLLKSQGWELLSRIYEEQIKHRRNAVEGALPKSMDDLIEMQRLMCEANGVRLAVTTPIGLLEQLEETQKLLLEALEK